MRIALFLVHLRAGGAERVMVTLANSFATRGHAVQVVLSEAEGELLKELNPTIPVVDLGARRMLRALPRLARYLRMERPDALLATLSQPNLVAILARRWARVPTRVIVREASTPTQEYRRAVLLKDRLVPWFIATLYRDADAVIAVSKGVAHALAQLGVPSPQVIYNPVITPHLLSACEESLNHPWFQLGEPPVVLAVGRLGPEKDYPTLIKAFAQVVQMRPARLVILGEGEQRPALEALARTLGIADQVAMPGFVPNPFPYMRRASVYVLCSIYEGLPNALIQAMACGCPVVSTDCPSGPREILDGGRYGHLVPVGDSQALAEAILEVLSGVHKPVPSEWLQQFTEERVVEQYLHLLAGDDE